MTLRRGIGLLAPQRHRRRRNGPAVCPLFEKLNAPPTPFMEGRSPRRIGLPFRYRFQFGDALFQPLQALMQIGTVNRDLRWKWMVVAPAFQIRVRRVVVVMVNTPLPDVRKERLHRVKILCREGIEFVVMAFAAAHGRTEPGRGNRSYAIRGVLGQVFLRLRAALACHHVQAIEARGDELFGGRVRQQIARNLLPGELVERLVLVERTDDVVTIRKHIHVLVAVIADRVGKPREIEPRHGHPFPQMRRIQQPIELAFVGLRTRILEKRPHFLRRRRQADEVKAQTSQQRPLIRFR